MSMIIIVSDIICASKYIITLHSHILGGQTKAAQKSYIEGISAVLNNCKKYLKGDYNVFLVANDKYNLYPQIAEKSGMKIVN